MVAETVARHASRNSIALSESRDCRHIFQLYPAPAGTDCERRFFTRQCALNNPKVELRAWLSIRRKRSRSSALALHSNRLNVLAQPPIRRGTATCLLLSIICLAVFSNSNGLTGKDVESTSTSLCRHHHPTRIITLRDGIRGQDCRVTLEGKFKHKQRMPLREKGTAELIQ